MQKRLSKTLALILILLMSFALLSGCGQAAEGDGETHIVKDCLGRDVSVSKEIKTIAALDAFAGQAVIMFGHGAEMKATVGGVKRDILLQEICPSLENAVIVKEGGSVNAEALLSLQPDVLFIKGDMYLNTPEREKLDKLGIPYFVIDYKSMEDQMEAFRVIGQALGEEEEAQKVIEYYRSAVDRVGTIADKIPKERRPRIYHSITQAVRTDSADTLGADWISVTKAENVSLGGDLTFDEKNYYATLEQIFVWDPDLIICNESGVSNYILSDEKWKGLRAVREQKVYQMPIGVSRWGHQGGLETPLAIFWLAKLIYPNEFEDLDLKEEMRYFYGTFYDYNPTDEVLNKILAGEGIRVPSSNAVGD